MTMLSQNRPTVLSMAAHPDDIGFLFAGTLLLFKEAGCPIHLWTLANGSLGSMMFLKAYTIFPGVISH